MQPCCDFFMTKTIEQIQDSIRPIIWYKILNDIWFKKTHLCSLQKHAGQKDQLIGCVSFIW